MKNHAALRSTPASTRSTDAYNTAEPWLCHIGRVRTATSRLAFSPSCRQWRSLTTTGVMPALRCGRTSAMSRSDLRSASPTDRGPAGDHTTAMLDLGSATIVRSFRLGSMGATGSEILQWSRSTRPGGARSAAFAPPRLSAATNDYLASEPNQSREPGRFARRRGVAEP